MTPSIGRDDFRNPVDGYPIVGESIDYRVGVDVRDWYCHWPSREAVYDRKEMIEVVGDWHGN